MSFPETNRVVYQQNPLVEVICQLRFPTILEISSVDPAVFQKKVRSAYPLYAKDGVKGAIPSEISEVLAQLNFPNPGPTTTHKFLAENSARFISLSREFLALTETQYNRWEELHQQIELARAVLEEVYEPSFYTRIGLRYRNIIDKSALGLNNEPWSALFNPALAGILGAEDIRPEVQAIASEAVISVDSVQGGAVKLRYGLTKMAPSSKLVYLIDADFFTEQRSATRNVTECLDRFNRHAGNLFRWAISPRLQEALGPMEFR